MRLTKWNGSSNNGSSTLTSGGSGGSSSENYGGGGSVSLNRTIWGKHDDGGDIDGHQTVNGDVHIRAIIPPTYDPDDPDEDVDGEDEEQEEGGGNLDVELDATVGRHLYISYPHPNHQGEKKCVGELIKSNADAISNLTTKVNTNTTNIANLTQTVENNTTNISNNADEISKLKAGSLTEEDVLKLIRDNQPSKLGAYDQPVVLLSGVLERSTTSTTNWLYAVHHLPHFDIEYPKINGGLMTIDLKVDAGYSVNVCAIHATQYHSGDTTTAVDNPTVNGRSDGAHWFECRRDSGANTKKIYIREFHQKNGDNDSWGSDWWGGDGGGIQKINITLIGHITPPAS